MIEPLYPWRALLFAFLIVAAIIDVRSYRIPNALALLTFIAAIVLLLAVGAPRAAFGQAMVSGLIGLAVGYALFALGVMGGGDGKLFGAVAAWFGLGALVDLGFWISLSGVGVALFALFVRMVARKARLTSNAGNGKNILKTPIPYGVAIAAGAIIAAQAPMAI